MRILFATQGVSLDMFDAVREALSKKVKLEKVGFTISDSSAYIKFKEKQPDFDKKGYILLKEWEVTSEKTNKPDLETLRVYEEEIGGKAGLFGAIVADRRLFMGKDCTYTQDYSRRFSDDELLSILQAALIKTELLFNELKPDLVVSFICVTILDYLVYLFARVRGIKFLNIRPTRVADRITVCSTLNDPSPEFIKTYEKCLNYGSKYLVTAREHIQNVRNNHGRYEGVVKASSLPALKVNRERRNLISSVFHVMRNYLNYRNSIAASDNHVVNPLRALFFASLLNPLRAKRIRAKFNDKYVSVEKLTRQRYVFFPLHTEPEVSLLVYGRPFLNQIEVIRQLAISLPSDMILVVKEHPWMVGKRSESVYNKILNIPRVCLVDPATDARDLISNAELVSVITGSIALESAILGKPVLTFGDGPFNALPDTMVVQCRDMRILPQLIKQLLLSTDTAGHEDSLEAYISAVYENSVSVNLYSVLLKKNDVYALRKSSYEQEVEKLSTYIYERSKDSFPGYEELHNSVVW